MTGKEKTQLAAKGASERTSGRLLALLKQGGAQCAGQLADSLGLSEQGVRRHLGRLSAEGLIEARTEKPLGRGRPQQVYHLTEAGEARFPRNYSGLCVDILHHLQAQYGRAAVAQILTARARAQAEQLQATWPPEAPLPEELQHLRDDFQAAGYGTALEEDGEAFYLIHHNCPHLTVAREFGELCASERQLLAEVLRAPVVCQSRAAAGGRQCRYRVHKPQQGAQSGPEDHQ